MGGSRVDGAVLRRGGEGVATVEEGVVGTADKAICSWCGGKAWYRGRLCTAADLTFRVGCQTVCYTQWLDI